MEVINWLLESDPYVEYATRINILKQDKSDLLELKKSVLSDERIKGYLRAVENFYSIVVTTHKNPELQLHKLIFLLDMGLGVEVAQIDTAIKKILGNIDENGMYKSLTNIPVHYGGTGDDSFAWAMCDAPLMLYALAKAGVSYEKHIKSGVEYIVGLQRDNGVPCVVSKELSKFRGPGRKNDCCPYATLAVLKLLSILPEYENSDLAKKNIDVLLSLWENSKELHPYMFFMGTDFRKLKAPAIWYDIVNVAECLSHFNYARKDERFQEMVRIIVNKANKEHRFTPESIYLKCKDWDFGQKNVPSPYLTYLCLKIMDQNNIATI